MTMSNSLNDEDVFFYHYSADEFCKLLLSARIGGLVLCRSILLSEF